LSGRENPEDRVDEPVENLHSEAESFNEVSIMKSFIAAFVLISAAAVFGEAPSGGGIAEIDVNNRQVKKAAQVATVTITQWKNSPNHQNLVEIKSAHVQVVSGLLYHLEIEIQDSGCPKTEALEGCQAEPLDQFEVCKIKVLKQPWLGFYQVFGDIKCQPLYHF